MLAGMQLQPSLVRRQIEQLQSSASGRLPPHLSGTPLRPRLTRARTNLDVVWRSLDRDSSENRDPVTAPSVRRGGRDVRDVADEPGRPLKDASQEGVRGLNGVVSRSVTHLHQLHLCDVGVDDVGEAKGRNPQRQPLRAIQRAELGPWLGPPPKAMAPKPPTGPKALTALMATSQRGMQRAQDAVYQTIEEKVQQPPHYDKPVSPPVPVDPTKRKRKAEGSAGEDQRTLGTVEAAGKATAATAIATTSKPCPRGEPKGPKPSTKSTSACIPGHRTLPRKLTGLSVVAIDVDLGAADGRQGQDVGGAACGGKDLGTESHADPDPTSSSSSSTLPLKKSARGGQLWRRFSSFNPCSRWDEWNSSKKSDVKRPTSTVKHQSDQRPPVPNRPLPPTPRPPPEKPSLAETGLLAANLDHQPWFHNVDRKQAEELIKNGIDGYFLIRPSSQSQNPLTLTLWYNQRVYNISVRQRKDGRIALGFEKPDEQSFMSIEEMVTNYQSENLLLFSRNERTGRTVLTKSPPKQSH